MAYMKAAIELLEGRGPDGWLPVQEPGQQDGAIADFRATDREQCAEPSERAERELVVRLCRRLSELGHESQAQRQLLANLKAALKKEKAAGERARAALEHEQAAHAETRRLARERQAERLVESAVEAALEAEQAAHADTKRALECRSPSDGLVEAALEAQLEAEQTAHAATRRELARVEGWAEPSARVARLEAQLEAQGAQLTGLEADESQAGVRLTGRLEAQQRKIDGLAAELERWRGTAEQAGRREAVLVAEARRLNAALERHGAAELQLRAELEQLRQQLEGDRRRMAVQPARSESDEVQWWAAQPVWPG